ncbi:hypothetical protein FJT64_023534 [Amphibalanus amphitrite]|uniref:Uncharacterized protein n=1 Tax=Amphibalanus amphitrite TaxID=1232801 RepID=A0A6A4WDI7_AMPAM|nr:hypothetical protein FJT64_023533 [Amphibalanus amphitrite]KAF0304716.1 hypothetical protein FJT64_023534 [Amphibalanus amphitrite]
MLVFLITCAFIMTSGVAGELPCPAGQQLLLNGTCAPWADGPCPTVWRFRQRLSEARSQLEAVRAATCAGGGTEACWECPWTAEPAELHQKLQQVLRATQELSDVWQACSATATLTLGVGKVESRS